MADGLGIRVKADKALVTWTENVIPHFRNVVMRATEDMAFAAGVEAQANAPIDTGDLRRSIRAKKPELKLGAGGAVVVETLLEASEPYALKMHESLLPYGAGRFNLGPLSAQQPPTKTGGVGGKYISRAIERNIKFYESILARIVENNLGGAAKGVKVQAAPIRRTPSNP